MMAKIVIENTLLSSLHENLIKGLKRKKVLIVGSYKLPITKVSTILIQHFMILDIDFLL